MPDSPRGIAAGHEQPLAAPDAVYEDGGQPGEQPLDVRDVVGAGGRVQQVGAGHVRLAAADGMQSAEAAHVGGGDLEARVPALELVLQHADGQVVAAGAEHRVLDLLRRSQKLNADLLAGVDSFHASRNAQEPVGPAPWC